MRLFPILYSFIITFFLTKHKCFTAFSLSVYRFFSHIKRAVSPRPFHSSCPSCPSCSAFSPSLRLIPFGDLFFFRQFASPFSSLPPPPPSVSFSFLSSPIRFPVLAFSVWHALFPCCLACSFPLPTLFPSAPAYSRPVFYLFRPSILSLSARFTSRTRFIFFCFPPSCSSRSAPFFSQSFSALSEKIQNPLLSVPDRTGRALSGRPTPFKTSVPENKPIPFSECQGFYSDSGI